jgi:tRNA(Ile)-lysidine synthase
MDLRAQTRDAIDALGIKEHERIAVACSGGADSIALLHLLCALRPGIVVLHVDHGLRDESSADAAFVAMTADALGLQVHVERVDVDRTTGSLEGAARDARYRALEEMAVVAGARYVATAHTLDDQAETVLQRLMRGASLDGIAPMRGMFVRPLLGVRRSALRTYLVDQAISWREDPSNVDQRFERNWVRARLLPQIAERRPGIVDVLARTASRQRMDGAVLDDLAAEAFDGHAKVDTAGVFLPSADLDPLPAAIASRVVRLAFRHGGTEPPEHVIQRARHLEAGVRVRHGGIDAWRLADGLAFVRHDREPPAPFDLPANGTITSHDWAIAIRVGDGAEHRWPWRYVLPDAAATIRSRRPGDRVETSAGSKKVQDMLVDAKVPRPLRDLVPIIATSSAVVAVVGHAPSGRRRRGTASLESGRVVDVRPLDPTWSRERVWGSR